MCRSAAATTDKPRAPKKTEAGIGKPFTETAILPFESIVTLNEPASRERMDQS